MYVYTILTDADSGKRYREAEAEAVARIDELSGRNIGRYIVRTAIPAAARMRGSAGAYVAADAGSPAREAGMRGFRVRRELAYARTDAALVQG